MEMMELIDKLQEHYKDFSKRMRGRIYYDDQETKTLLDGYTEELASFFSKELSRARGEGIREAVEEAYEYGRDSIRLPMSLTKEQVIDKLLNNKK